MSRGAGDALLKPQHRRGGWGRCPRIRTGGSSRFQTRPRALARERAVPLRGAAPLPPLSRCVFLELLVRDGVRMAVHPPGWVLAMFSPAARQRDVPQPRCCGSPCSGRLQRSLACPCLRACAVRLAAEQLAVAKFPTLHPLRTEDISPQELILASACAPEPFTAPLCQLRRGCPRWETHAAVPRALAQERRMSMRRY